MILDTVNELIEFESKVFHYSLMEKIYYRNLVLGELNLSYPKEFTIEDKENVKNLRLPDSLIESINLYLSEVLKLDGKEQELKLTKIFGLITPSPKEIEDHFLSIEKNSPKEALDYLYNLSIANNYIQKSKIEKNLLWDTNFKKNNLEISINLSKPEKNVKDIAKLLQKPKESETKYPKCLLCLENLGFYGSGTHPARENLRLIPLKLNKKDWYLQYSPYGYFNMHSIILYIEHVNMVINKETFINLTDFVDRFPCFFIGSNADLPIVGGSILNHEHYQGGEHILPIMKSKNKKEYRLNNYPNSKLFLLDWYNTTLLLEGKNKNELIDLANKILLTWRTYSSPENEIIAKDENGEHNTITPSVKKIKDIYYIYLILRNNRCNELYKEGIFHAHPEYYHIKKENIGIIEAMGLFVLPARLKRQMEEISSSLDLNLNDEEIYKKYPDLIEFKVMIQALRNDDSKLSYLDKAKKYIDEVCRNILINTGVFKDTKVGNEGIDKFIKECKL